MNKRIVLFFLALSVVFSVRTLAFPRQYENYFGIGVSTSPFNSESVSDIGFQLCYGHRFMKTISGELKLLLYPLKSEGEWYEMEGLYSVYTVLSTGLKFDLRSIDKRIWTPWICFDLTFYTNVPYLFLSAFWIGITPAAGIDVRLGKQVILQGAYRANYADNEYVLSGEESLSHTFTGNLLFRF